MKTLKKSELFKQYDNCLQYLLTQSRQIDLSDNTVLQMYYMALKNLFGSEKQDFINKHGEEIKKIQIKIMADAAERVM